MTAAFVSRYLMARVGRLSVDGENTIGLYRLTSEIHDLVIRPAVYRARNESF